MFGNHPNPAGRLEYLRTREQLADDELARAERDAHLGMLGASTVRRTRYADRLARIRQAITDLEPEGEDPAHCTSCGILLVGGACFATDCGRTW